MWQNDPFFEKSSLKWAHFHGQSSLKEGVVKIFRASQTRTKTEGVSLGRFIHVSCAILVYNTLYTTRTDYLK